MLSILDRNSSMLSSRFLSARFGKGLITQLKVVSKTIVLIKTDFVSKTFTVIVKRLRQ